MLIWNSSDRGYARPLVFPDISKIVNLIPSSRQYPDSTCARITVKGQEFKTGNFKKSRWRQSEDILLRGSVIGAVDICYLKKKPEADETSNVIIPAVMKTGQWDGESIVKRKDGSLVPIWLTISIAKDTDGKPMALVSTVKDIADIKKAETDLRKSEQWSRNMIDSAQEGVWVLDNDSKTTFVNEQMVKILGYDGNEMLGRSILDFMDADAKKDAVRYMQRRLQGVAES